MTHRTPYNAPWPRWGAAQGATPAQPGKNTPKCWQPQAFPAVPTPAFTHVTHFYIAYSGALR